MEPTDDTQHSILSGKRLKFLNPFDGSDWLCDICVSASHAGVKFGWICFVMGDPLSFNFSVS